MGGSTACYYALFYGPIPEACCAQNPHDSKLEDLEPFSCRGRLFLPDPLNHPSLHLNLALQLRCGTCKQDWFQHLESQGT